MKLRRLIPIALYAILLVVLFVVLLNMFGKNTQEISYSQAVTQIQSKNVSYLKLDGNVLTLKLLQPVEGKNEVFHKLADPDGFWEKMEDDFAALKQEGVLTDYNYIPGRAFSVFDLILPMLIVGLVLLAVAL